MNEEIKECNATDKQIGKVITDGLYSAKSYDVVMCATQKRKYNALDRIEMMLNLHLAKACRLSDYGNPIVASYNGTVPTQWVGFNSSKNIDKPNTKGVHFYVDDYQFERLWRSPGLYEQRLSKFCCIISPDFSLFVDMPTPMKIWNVYRNRLFAAWWQHEGMNVIPNVSWSDPNSYGFCFDGLPTHSIIAIGSMGAKQHGLTKYLWRKGYDMALQLLNPSLILRYGEKIEGEDVGRTIYIENSVIRRLHNGR